MTAEPRRAKNPVAYYRCPVCTATYNVDRAMFCGRCRDRGNGVVALKRVELNRAARRRIAKGRT